MMPWARHLTLGAGHVPFFDDPAAVAEVIRSCAGAAASAGESGAQRAPSAPAVDGARD